MEQQLMTDIRAGLAFWKNWLKTMETMVITGCFLEGGVISDWY